jgi:SAM-dependent methyltransferase
MRDFYSGDYHDNRDTEECMGRYAIQSNYLPFLKHEKVLDIGCARGDFLIFLKKQYPGIKPYGIDFFCDRVKSDEITFVSKLLPDAHFPDSEFDLVTAWAVFEHLHKPGEYFKEVQRILKPNGKFVFLVTNAESLYGKRAYIEDIPRHTFHFSERTLYQYANKYGFNMTRCEYDDRIFDGRGTGTCYYTITSLMGVTWDKRYSNKLNLLQSLSGSIGVLLDKLIFSEHWEAKRKKSGIMIIEFVKL